MFAFPLRYNTASQEIPLGPFLDSTDGNTQETGLTIANTDIKIWKSGATTEASKNSGGATHIANGRYYAVLDATDTDTVGPLRVACHPTGALAVQLLCVVLPQHIYDWLLGNKLLLTHPGEFSISGTTVTAYENDGTTSQRTYTATESASANPITGLT